MYRRSGGDTKCRTASTNPPARCSNPEIAANHEVNRRFERLRERFLVLNRSTQSLNEKHDGLQERFDKLVDEFNENRQPKLSPHLVWRLVATLAK